MKKAVEKNDMEYAVFETGGKQYAARIGDVVTIEGKDANKEGEAISFEKVLLVASGPDTTVGTPYITGATVIGKVLELGKTKKLSVIRFRSKSRHRRKIGHRSHISKIEIVKIS